MQFNDHGVLGSDSPALVQVSKREYGETRGVNDAPPGIKFFRKPAYKLISCIGNVRWRRPWHDGMNSDWNTVFGFRNCKGGTQSRYRRIHHPLLQWVFCGQRQRV